MTTTAVEPVKLANPNLEAILAYQNEDVIRRFLDKYQVTEEEAMDIFTETKKFLYLAHFVPAHITDDIVIIDEMWHNFILFTAAYQKFCEEFFGCFKHHLPTSMAEKENHKRRFKEDPQAVMQDATLQLEGLMSAVYDHLGAQTLIKWFDEYSEKYTRDQVKTLFK